MDANKSAEAILEAVGGAENVAALQHCSTRLRFALVDDRAADKEKLKAAPGVLEAVMGPPQTQAIIGNQVIEVYNALNALLGGAPADEAAAAQVKQPWTWKRAGNTIMGFVVSVFTPVVPAIAGAGVLKSLLILVSTLGWVSETSPSYLVLLAIPNAVFAFLPLFVAYTTAKKLNVNIPLAIGIVGVLLYPGFTALLQQEGGISLFGMSVKSISYDSQVFSAILSVLFLAVVERFFNKITPGPIRVFFVPMMCFFIVVPATVLLLGPLGYNMGTVLTSGMLWLHSTLGWVAVALLAAALPFVIAVGMHKAFIPPTLNTMSATGAELLYLPASLAHNMAEAGATLAVALRTKRTDLRATSFSSGVSALFGITEPALYGVTLQTRRVLLSVIAGAFAGGSYVGITHVSAHAVVGPGLASMSMFVNSATPHNILHAVIGLLVAFAAAFLVSALTWKDAGGTDTAEEKAREEQGPAADEARGGLLIAPVTGTAIALSEVPDPVFSGGVLGLGLAVEPASGRFLAPVSGTVTSLLPSKHAVGITTEGGAEVLIHVGIDTVKLHGEHFTAHIAQGDHVTAGQPLLDVDLDAVRAAGYPLTTPVIVLNSGTYTVVDLAAGPVEAGSPLALIREKELAHVTA
ncbi:beta-glucoside-specific PTS transporter subunit IIABC [Streptomyces sp. NPDC093111]|uniref:beta-glucoside-specific PTS transporter subunit IIABC n=1 Tax=Streptomyces sp. NPDC093111 TaxID=3154978 RepID=UPI003427BB6B